MNDKYKKDIAEAIESLAEEILECKEQIEVVKNIDFNAPVDEDTWHEICLTPLRTSDLMGKLLKNIFPNAEDIKVGSNYVVFTLYGFKCFLPTSDYYQIEVDTSWYIKDKGLETFPEYCKRTGRNITLLQEEYLKIEKPTFKQKINYVFDTPRYKNMPYWKKIFLYIRYHSIYKAATDKDRIKILNDCNIVHKLYDDYVARYCKDRKEMQLNIDRMNKILLPELMKFTKNIKAYGNQFNGYFSPQELIEAEGKILHSY